MSRSMRNYRAWGCRWGGLVVAMLVLVVMVVDSQVSIDTYIHIIRQFVEH